MARLSISEIRIRHRSGVRKIGDRNRRRMEVISKGPSNTASPKGSDGQRSENQAVMESKAQPSQMEQMNSRG